MLAAWAAAEEEVLAGLKVLLTAPMGLPRASIIYFPEGSVALAGVVVGSVAVAMVGMGIVVAPGRRASCTISPTCLSAIPSS